MDNQSPSMTSAILASNVMCLPNYVYFDLDKIGCGVRSSFPFRINKPLHYKIGFPKGPVVYQWE